MAISVFAPDGEEWTVRRRLAPRLGSESLWGHFRNRTRNVARRTSHIADGADAGGCLEVFGDGFAFGIAVIIGILLLIFVIIPLLVAIVDVLIVVLLALIGIGARIALRRPWVIEARATSTGRTESWRVIGWRAGDARIVEIAERIERGRPADG